MKEGALTEVTFGEWLKRQRMGRGLTREQLARQIGCAAVTLRKIEVEERRPSAEIVDQLIKIFEIPQQERTNFLKFARGDWTKTPGERSVELPWQASKSPRTNLPAPVTSFIGRDKEQNEVLDLLVKNRLVTLVGPPGIGKTRLSIEAARKILPDFPEGVFFVAFAPLEDPSLIALAIVQALGYVEAKNIPARQQLMDGIGEKQMLLVLDNCEHLIEEVAPIASDLISACSQLKILATSRESIRVPGEWLYPVPALEVPKESSSMNVETASKFPALTLFTERARAVRLDFALNADNIQTVSCICAQLDGLPLAIELLAARMRLMSPAALLELWNAQFILSADGVRAVTTRQKTLNNAIAWSYNLLSAEEQKLFAYLSIFSGGFTLDSAQSVFSRFFVEKPVRDLITSLLDKSLLQRIFNEHGEPRFTMLVTIQEFARERLRDMGDEAEVRNWHLAYFLDLAEQADHEIHGPTQVAWMDRLDTELDNFRAALDWGLSSGQTEKLLRLFAALGWDWLVRWSLSEYRHWLDTIRALPDIGNHPATYARILNLAAHQEWVAGNFGQARCFVEESQVIWLKLGIDGERGLAESLYLSGMILMIHYNLNGATSYLKQSLELHQKCGDRWGVAMTKFLLGNVTLWNDEDSSALFWLTQSLDLFHELGDPWGVATSAERLGELFLKQGNYEKARLYFDQLLRINEGLHFHQGIGVALCHLGTLYRYQGDYDQATHFYEKGLTTSRECGSKWSSTNILFWLGLVDLQRNDYQQAKQKIIDYYNVARAMYEGGIGECDFLTGMAAVAGGTNQPERAAKLYGAAQALFEVTDYRISPFDRAEFDRHIQIAEEKLGGAKFEDLMSEGRAMTMEQAIQYALELATSL